MDPKDRGETLIKTKTSMMQEKMQISVLSSSSWWVTVS